MNHPLSKRDTATNANFMPVAFQVFQVLKVFSGIKIAHLSIYGLNLWVKFSYRDGYFGWLMFQPLSMTTLRLWVIEQGDLVKVKIQNVSNILW